MAKDDICQKAAFQAGNSEFAVGFAENMLENVLTLLQDIYISGNWKKLNGQRKFVKGAVWLWDAGTV